MHSRKLPNGPPIPVTLLGRLAIARSHHGKGLGAALLMDAMRRALEHSEEVGAMAVVVDATDEAAARFYAKHGFIAFPERPLRLFIPMATIERLG